MKDDQYPAPLDGLPMYPARLERAARSSDWLQTRPVLGQLMEHAALELDNGHAFDHRLAA